jgi:hypothetical protein
MHLYGYDLSEEKREFWKKFVQRYKRNKIKVILSVTIFVVTVVFQMGDDKFWWDYIFGRSTVLHSIEILTNGEDLSNSQNPKEFRALVDIIETHQIYPPFIFEIPDKDIIGETTATYLYDVHPSRIYIAPPITITSGLLGSNYILDNTPVLFEYNVPSGREILNGVAYTNINELNYTPTSTLVGSVRDIKDWVEDSRKGNRFIVLIVFIGLLNLVSVLF